MMPVAQAIRAASARIAPTASIAIAFSGGLDSTVLLDASVATIPGARARCVAIHVNDGLSPSAAQWQAHCRREARRRGLRFATETVDLAPLRARGMGIEAASRTARYAALARLAEANGASVIWLGQHADDQAETVLLQMLRGAGLPGLAAMPTARAAPSLGADVSLVRPFLGLPRAMLAQYADAHRLSWVEDESNDDVRLKRNALRRDVLPSLARYFPAYRQTLARVARHAASAQALCDEIAREDWFACVAPSAASASEALSLRALQRLSAARQANLLRFWLRRRGLSTPSTRRLDEMVRQLNGAMLTVRPPGAALDSGARGDGLSSDVGTRSTRRTAARLAIRHDGFTLHLYRDRVYWRVAAPFPAGEAHTHRDGSDAATAAPTLTLNYDGRVEWSLPPWRGDLTFTPVTKASSSSPVSIAETGATRAAGATAPGTMHVLVPRAALYAQCLEVRARTGGERLRVHARRPSRTLKQLFQSAGVPPSQRSVPLFYLQGVLFFVPGLGGSWPQDQGATAADPCGDWVSVSWRPWPLQPDGAAERPDDIVAKWRTPSTR